MFNDGASIFATSLERDSLGSAAGIPLSNSRILAVDASFQSPAPGVTYFASLFLQFTSLARIYLSNIVLET
jgi:hypothetical protein